ncbi:hypothetical protein ACYSNR_09380 [Enterococcus sp. LJL128]|uniref:hypothetical protein n=1 Tax=Enterococcus sp. LJL51 TaxID=3416656 RepID=UPI003CF43728
METKGIKVWPVMGVIASLVVSFISLFLPIMAYGSETYSSYWEDGDGEIAMFVTIAVVLVGIFAVLTLVTKKRVLNTITGILSIIAGLLLPAGNALIVFVGFDRVGISPAIGIYLMFVGTVALFVFGIITLRANKKKKASAAA